MRTAPIRVLIVDDEAAHIEAIRRAFEAARPEVEIRTAGTLAGYREQLEADLPDIALADFILPDGRVLDVLTSPPEAGPFPVVVMTGYGNEQTAVEAMKAGALDYVVKSEAAFLEMPRTVERALREWHLLQERKQAMEALSASRFQYREPGKGAGPSTSDPPGRPAHFPPCFENAFNPACGGMGHRLRVTGFPPLGAESFLFHFLSGRMGLETGSPMPLYAVPPYGTWLALFRLFQVLVRSDASTVPERLQSAP